LFLGNISLGGIVHHNSNSGIISYCINNGSITTNDRIGGIAGNNEGHIISCLNTGKITATNTSVGGIVGRSLNGQQTLRNSINIGSVEGFSGVSGIIGSFTENGTHAIIQSFRDNINYGLVKGNSSVGGIVG